MELKWNTFETIGDSEADIAAQFVTFIKAKKNLKFYKNQSAVYFISTNAGNFSSIAFWENALKHSPRFANPGIFPWTLANATSGYIARQFGITGPNYTIIEPCLNREQLISNYKTDKLKYQLKNAICVQWEIKVVKNLLSVLAKWTILQ
ncbi:hypothetical protein KO494_11300 [Lacinutrix sp. C3R15]|uniref:hypothetical protein n=1 Tax=Flavobacteriaceae TaxID=49546 RepID=UPI001C08CB5B|nr:MULTISPECIES: hypothetical protein [Flavobacteriaceae]MBU2940124.1 hypothetical protein [Lacinutrix sp. C3R15]MDO6623441.1 hypothetical protein [Oceanihabitans sp. 1_MG-2023]